MQKRKQPNVEISWEKVLFYLPLNCQIHHHHDVDSCAAVAVHDGGGDGEGGGDACAADGGGDDAGAVDGETAGGDEWCGGVYIRSNNGFPRDSRLPPLHHKRMPYVDQSISATNANTIILTR